MAENTTNQSGGEEVIAETAKGGKPTSISLFKYFFNDPEFLQDYKGTKVLYPLYETIEKVEKFQADPGDICIATFPKNGTAFLSAVVHMIMNEGDPKSLTEGPPLNQKILYLELNTPVSKDGNRFLDIIQRSTPPRVFFTHLGYDALPKSIRDNAKIVYLARNPKDVIVRNFIFFRSSPVFGFNGTLDDMMEAFFDNRCMYAPFYDHVAGYWKNHLTESNIFFTTFEQTAKDFEDIIQNLAKFLGKKLTPEQIKNVAHHCSAENLEKNDNVNRKYASKTGLYDFTQSLDAEMVGHWKSHFAPENVRRLDEWIAQEEERLKDSLEGFEFEYE